MCISEKYFTVMNYYTKHCNKNAKRIKSYIKPSTGAKSIVQSIWLQISFLVKSKSGGHKTLVFHIHLMWNAWRKQRSLSYGITSISFYMYKTFSRSYTWEIMDLWEDYIYWKYRQVYWRALLFYETADLYFQYII